MTSQNANFGVVEHVTVILSLLLLTDILKSQSHFLIAFLYLYLNLLLSFLGEEYKTFLLIHMTLEGRKNKKKIEGCVSEELATLVLPTQTKLGAIVFRVT